MKLWQIATLAVIVGTSSSRAATLPDVLPVNGSDGKTLAVVVQCNDCKTPTAGSKKACYTGAEKGWLDGKPCGLCLIGVNAVSQLKYPYDLQFTGKLVNDAGEPIKDRFVKMFLANGWTVKTRTSELGTFRLMLGATDERKSKTPLVIDLGQRVDRRKGKDDLYAFFLLPEGYAGCPAAAAEAGPVPKHSKPR